MLHTDTRAYQILYALFQEYPDKSRRPIVFWSRTLSNVQNNYSPTGRECLAVIYGVTVCRPYLHGQQFRFVTGHNSLCWINEIKDPTPGRLMQCRLWLAELDFDVAYRKESKHTQPDELSRITSNGHAKEHEELEIPCLNISEYPTSSKNQLYNYPPALFLISVDKILAA